MIERSKNEPKLFYRYISGKMKSREGVDKLKVEGTVYRDALQQAEVMNKSFQTVFTRESKFKIINIIAMECLMENIKVDVKEVKQPMENQDVRKALGADGVSFWIMKECSNQLAVYIRPGVN